MEETKKTKGSKGSNLFASITIVLCLIVGFSIWHFVMGDGSNFEGGINSNQPLPGNFLGMIYKGGVVIPCIMGLLLMSFVFSIERFFVINKSSGKGNLDKFINRIQESLSSGNISEAIGECDRQQGSVGNVVKAALIRLKSVQKDNLEIEKASELIQKEIEEATMLEMPMLQKNMTVLSTLVSLGTLMGLLGTVSGMIKAFAGLATSGTPDQAQLANGISEALINTAFGIATSSVATVTYNYFTSEIDTLTYFIDEAGFVITQSYKKAH